MRPANAAWLLVVALTACNWLASAPEARARDLIDALITDPGNRARAVTLANVADETALTNLLSTELEIELTYLRARARQGAVTDIAIESVERLDPDRRHVRIAVTIADPRAGFDLRGREKDRTYYEVSLAQLPNAGWQVREIRALDE